MDYFVQIVPFPNYSANGFVVSNGDDTYTIFINANLSYDKQKEAFLHELNHINRGDLFREKDIKELEAS